MALIDVIVPVYQVEEYLPKCVDSLLAQDFSDFSITLVDDGSTDGCPVLCDRYAAERPGRVRVIHKQNGGLSDARNAGVAASDAAYVTFVDSDDHVSDTYLSELYGAAARGGADMAAAAFVREYPRPDGSFRHVRKQTLGERVLDRERALEEVCYERGLDGYACGKLLRRELALAHPFPVGRYFEDSFVVYRYVMDCGRVAMAPRAVYYYLQRENGLRARFEPKRLRDHIEAVTEMTELFRREDMAAPIQNAGIYKTYRACYGELYRAAAALDWAAFRAEYDRLRPVLGGALSQAAGLARAETMDRLLCVVLRHPRLFHAAVTVKERRKAVSV